MLPNTLAFIDTETTGLSPTRDHIIEIGIVRVENNKVVDTYQTLINPGFGFADIITAITGITPKDVEHAPSFGQVKNDIFSILKDCVFVAHNVRFDYGFLCNAFAREEMKFSSKQFCTARLSRSLFPQERSHNLDSIIKRFSIPCQNRHRAFDDAYVLWEFYRKLKEQIPSNLLEKYIAHAMKKPTLPQHLSAVDIESLPESAGVYVFFGDEKTPLYIGKSVNIKERVLSHFSGDYTSSKEMHISQQIKRIETYPTSGEFGALLKESTMIKQMQPLYNRRLRASRKMVLLKKKTDKEGYTQLYCEDATSIDPESLENILGVFKSKKAAKQFILDACKKYHLCEKLLSLEKTKGACFGHRLGSCYGACVGQELAIRYNVRVIEAFGGNSLIKWPFPGPIVVTEKDPIEKTTTHFVLDKWCVLGSVSGGEDNGFPQDATYSFDVDTYKILLSHLSQKKNWSSISQMPHLNKR